MAKKRRLSLTRTAILWRKNKIEFLNKANMKIESATLMLLGCLCTSMLGCNAQPSFGTNYLKLEKVISMPGVSGRIDHLAIDAPNQIAYIAALGNNTVEVVDLVRGKE